MEGLWFGIKGVGLRGHREARGRVRPHVVREHLPARPPMHSCQPFIHPLRTSHLFTPYVPAIEPPLPYQPYSFHMYQPSIHPLRTNHLFTPYESRMSCVQISPLARRWTPVTRGQLPAKIVNLARIPDKMLLVV